MMNQLKTYSCVVIDDNDIDRLVTYSLIKKVEVLNLVGQFSSVSEAQNCVDFNTIQIVFLDIDMPEINGLEFRKMMMNIPACIFITAHPEHAVESFELETLDFLVKPLTKERFGQTIIRIQEYLGIKEKALIYESIIENDYIFIKEGHEQVKIKLSEILYLEALKDYTLIITAHKRHCILNSLGTTLKQNAFASFVRIHKSYAVLPAMIIKIAATEIELLNQINLPIGRAYKSNIHI
jgi:two-component system, LytTR family, response regulator